MERDWNFPTSEPIKRVFRNPAYLGARLFLAGLTIGGVSACAPRGSENVVCPNSIADVSFLVGGSPENWKTVPEVKGAWVFKSDTPQVLHRAQPGRLGVVTSRSENAYNKNDFVTSAWYVCPESAGTPMLTPTPAR